VAGRCRNAAHHVIVEAAMVSRISAKVIEWVSRQPLFFQVASIVVLVTVLLYVLVFMLAVLVEV
jgi:F0F1-type ATP synthase membrane subunit c/vacuolar-type H+-ATPase subunit K